MFITNILILIFARSRWICTSGKENDLIETDKIAENCIKDILSLPDRKQIVFFKYKLYVIVSFYFIFLSNML